MSKIFIEEETLTAIGNAIREKEGTTELVPVNDMATRISTMETGSDPIIESLEITSNGTYTATDCDGYSPITVNVPQDGGPPEEAFNITGDCFHRFAFGGWDWFVDTYGDKITSNNISRLANIFDSSKLTEIPFVLNVSGMNTALKAFSNMTNLKVCPKVRGTFLFNISFTLQDMLNSCYNLRDAEDLFDPAMLDGYSTVKVTSAYSLPRPVNFGGCYSLRKMPSWWNKFKLNPESTTFPSATYALYANAFSACYSLDEIKGLPVWECNANATANLFTNIVGNTYRLKSFTFETDAGQPKTAKWKTQTLDFSGYIGHIPAASIYDQHITSYNSGIDYSKRVTNDTTYQRLKNDPDWYAADIAYSRYNHDSAVETINSLPDTSAYLASAGGTNTIKFKGEAGNKTDGGAINTLTAEEIAAAAAKGWTVTLV